MLSHANKFVLKSSVKFLFVFSLKPSDVRIQCHRATLFHCNKFTFNITSSVKRVQSFFWFGSKKKKKKKLHSIRQQTHKRFQCKVDKLLCCLDQAIFYHQTKKIMSARRAYVPAGMESDVIFKKIALECQIYVVNMVFFLIFSWCKHRMTAMSSCVISVHQCKIT